MISRVQKSKHVIQIFAAEQDEYYLYLFMELCYGGDLKSILGSHYSGKERFYFTSMSHTRPDSQTLDNRTSRRVLMQMLRGVMDIHIAGVLHRDLKPANILITNNGSLMVVMSFGLIR